MKRVPLLRAGHDEPFPPLASALRKPNGLLAVGGDLSPARLLDAYTQGIFPWFSDGEPIMWWSPDPRMVFATNAMHQSRTLRRWLRDSDWEIRADSHFAPVMQACAAPRPRQPSTWISPIMLTAYVRLHELGHAHSIEVFADEQLVGGIYGVAIGQMFYGESMFSGASNGSKVALLALARLLAQRGWPLIDAQVSSDHLTTLGAFEMPRQAFSQHIARLTAQPGIIGSWASEVEGWRSPDLLQD